MRNLFLYAVTAGLVVIAAVFGINAYYGASAASTYQKDVRRAWVELGFEHRWIGAQRPIVRIVVFTRFTCGPCQRLHDDLMELVDRYPEHVSVLYRHLLVGGDTIAVVTARATECAAEQGRLREVTDILFDAQDELAGGPWELVGTRAGIPQPNEFITCIAQRWHRVTLSEQQELSRLLRVQVVPTVFINEERYGNDLSSGQLAAEVARILRPEQRP